MIEWHVHADAAAMAEAQADAVARNLGTALQAKASALAVVPGGSTPGPALDRLAARPLDWGRIALMPTDERDVPPDHPLSNLGPLAARFEPLGARVIPVSAADGLAWPPDLVWLGMGSDGHIASIFPGPDMEKALAGRERVVAVRPDPLPAAAPVSRLTLSGPALLAAPVLFLAIRGAEKRRLLEAALEEGRESRYPVGRLLARASVPVHIHWCPA
ncbi:6-phosphogluconolactonase [Thermaurantiacus sp.]